MVITMRIRIHTPECNLSFALPTRLIFSSLTANLVCHGLNHTKILYKSNRKSPSPTGSAEAAPVSDELASAVAEVEAAAEELKLAEEELEALEAEAALEEANDFPGELEGDGGDPQDLHLSPAQMRELFKALRECRKEYPGLVLVDVHSAAGENVQITL